MFYYSSAGGPKLRKWYGAPDITPKDGNELEEDEAPGFITLIYYNSCGGLSFCK